MSCAVALATAVAGIHLTVTAGSAGAEDPPQVTFDLAYGPDPLQMLDVYPTSSPAPAVVLVHGGGWTGLDKAHLRTTAESLAADGFVVFNINYRLASALVSGYPMMTDDVAAAVAWVQQNGAGYGADTADINLVGGSAGGHLVALAGQLINTAAPATVRTVVSLSGPMDFVALNSLVLATPRGDIGRSGGYAYLGCLPSTCTQEQLEVPSPYYNIDPATCPAMMQIVSTIDMVPVAQATTMHDALAAVGCESIVTVPPGISHSFAMFPEHREAIGAFLRGEPPPIPDPLNSVGDLELTETAGADSHLLAVLDRPATEPVSVAYATRAVSASEGSDFVAQSGVISFEPGAVEARLPVQIVDDSIPESTETFMVELSDPLGADIGDGVAEVSILDDDSLPDPVAIDAVTPSSVGQGAAGRKITVTGARFSPETTVAVVGYGMTLSGLTILDPQTLTVVVKVTRAAPTGIRSLTVTTPGVGSATCDCLGVNPKPVPTMAGSSLGSGAIQRTVTVTGTGFTPGAVVRFPGLTGVSARTLYLSPDTLEVTVSVPPTAAAGAYNVQVTNRDGGTSVCIACFSVLAGPAPVSMTPFLVAGLTTAATITGSGFIDGATVTTPEGVTVADVIVVDATTITATLSVAPGTLPESGLAVTVTNPAEGGYGVGSCSCLTITG
ncbi:MAG: alpha/beta hydrolase fold domain-containing protein [Geodermatophilaceae bacterium]|nr:alpha/beta hydrolase fold domain-containing protein [Geodermatophilaceae bacterium]